MHMFINAAYSGLLIPINGDTGSLINALAQARPADSTGYGATKSYVVKNAALEIELVRDDRIGEPSTTESLLMAEKATSDKRWLEQYARANELEKQWKEVSAKLAAAQAAVNPA
jgi:hypothetical protein